MVWTGREDRCLSVVLLRQCAPEVFSCTLWCSAMCGVVYLFPAMLPYNHLSCGGLCCTVWCSAMCFLPSCLTTTCPVVACVAGRVARYQCCQCVIQCPPTRLPVQKAGIMGGAWTGSHSSICSDGSRVEADADEWRLHWILIFANISWCKLAWPAAFLSPL